MHIISSEIENQISLDKNILVVLLDTKDRDSELTYLIENFCGKVVEKLPDANTLLGSNKKVYVCGDLSRVSFTAYPVFIIREYSSNYDNGDNGDVSVITLGQVPVVIHGAGVYFRNLFDADDYFTKIKSEHALQELTESVKETKALRKGIYLTEITKDDTSDKIERLHYHLLRCSSNLTGPTDNFRATDHKIIRCLNREIKYVFEKETRLNHVLAQIYENKKGDNQKEVKSKIKAHSDKTKDMPKEGLIAFCTFYDRLDIAGLNPSVTDRYDVGYKQISALTKLHFKLKSTINDDSLAKEFSVTLYPNSVFIIPLSTNRLYTHEIRPSALNIDKIPTRMGYVVRCSNIEAVHMNNATYIKEGNKLIPLEPMTPEMLENLRNSYYEENTTENRVEYGKIHFSMNLGDYEKPIY